MIKESIGVVIQARLGSSRLPGKILKPFYNDISVLDILLQNLKLLGDFPIVLATSSTIEDQQLKSFADKHNVLFYQGDERNVLSRFLQVSEINNFSSVIRICSDNPFLQIPYLQMLVDNFQSENMDYLSFENGLGTPVIKTHFGLFGEIIKVDALKKVNELTSDNLYLEHVTNYIYSNAELFKVKFLKLPSFLNKRKNLRFTLDDQQDFHLLKILYDKYYNELDNSIEELVNFVDSNQEYLELMVKNIEKHNK